MDTPHTRKIHLVGTIPAESDAAAMRWALEQTENGGLLHTLPTGETGKRKNWIIHTVESMREHPDLTLRADGTWSNYKDLPSFKIKRGHEFRSESLSFGYAEYTAEIWDSFQTVRKAAKTPNLPLQVSIPGDLDLAMFTLGPIGPLRHRGPFAEATVRDIAAIHSAVGDDAVFQIEIPAELVFVAKAPGALQATVANRLAKGITSLAEQSPSGTRFGIHLCLGDMNNKALGKMRNVAPLVAMSNAITDGWPLGRSLEFIHAPLAAADSPPPVQRDWYSPLKGLRLPEQTRFAAGLAHESTAVSDAEQAETLALVEGLIGQRVDVAAACGFGRRDVETAAKVMHRSRFLAGRP